MLEDMVHLTWSGRWEMLSYAIRRRFIEPAPVEDRCIMGSPISDHVWCPRRSEFDGLWCRKHVPHNGG